MPHFPRHPLCRAGNRGYKECGNQRTIFELACLLSGGQVGLTTFVSRWSSQHLIAGLYIMYTYMIAQRRKVLNNLPGKSKSLKSKLM